MLLNKNMPANKVRKFEDVTLRYSSVWLGLLGLLGLELGLFGLLGLTLALIALIALGLTLNNNLRSLFAGMFLFTNRESVWINFITSCDSKSNNPG